jgi:hypothetical protein
LFASIDTAGAYKRRIILKDNEGTIFAIVPLGPCPPPLHEMLQCCYQGLSGMTFCTSCTGKTTLAVMTSDFGIYLTTINFSEVHALNPWGHLTYLTSVLSRSTASVDSMGQRKLSLARVFV